MNKKFLTFVIFFVVIAGMFFSSFEVYSQTTVTPPSINLPPPPLPTNLPPPPTGSTPSQANLPPPPEAKTGGSVVSEIMSMAGNALLKPLFMPIGALLLSISAGILTFTGWIFDGIVSLTIVNVADYLGSDKKIGMAVFQAWSTLRDVANMFFIFVLIYAAIKAMFDLGFSSGTLIRNIILVALLINFSLFFTKVVIDASNVVSVGFYQAIANSNTATMDVQDASGETREAEFRGISGGYMRMLGLQTFYGAGILEGEIAVQEVMTLAIMGSLFMLIASVIFLISGVMFIARFVILIFLMILSPLAFIAIIIPNGMDIFNKWKSALIDQSFFAPVFFALTWVSFKLGSALLEARNIEGMSWTDMITKPAATQTGTTGLLINFTLIIGFSIAALIFAKQMATKTAGFAQISGAIGAGAVGGAAFAGRQTIGRYAKNLSESKRDAWSKTALGRVGLNLADKTSSASFDVRGLSETVAGKAVGMGKMTDIIGKAGGKGGFRKSAEDKGKRKAEYAKRVYGQTAEENEAAAEKLAEFNELEAEDRERIKADRQKLVTETKQTLDKISNERDAHLEENTKPERDSHDRALGVVKEREADVANKEAQLERVRKFGTKSQVFDAEEEFKKSKEALGSAQDHAHSEYEKIQQKKIEVMKTEQYKAMTEEYARAKQSHEEAEKKSRSDEFADSEYSQKVKDAKEAWLAKKDAGKRRMQNYAERLKKKFGTGNKEASRKVREVAEGKDKKDKKQLKKDLAKMGLIDDDGEEENQENQPDKNSKNTK